MMVSASLVLNNPNTLVKQPYAITMAKHDFNVHEMRIMTRITQALQKDMLYGKTRIEVQNTLIGDAIIRIPTKSLIPKGSKNHAMIKRALKSLEKKTMTIRGKDKYGSYETTARLIMKSKYYLNNEMIEIQLDRDIVPDYLALASYSKYIAEISMDSSSRYIMRMYQFISHWKDKTKKSVMLDELRDILEIGEKYDKPGAFRKHILEPCIEDLKGRADVWFNIDSPIKAGRAIIGYIFNIYKREYNPRHSSVHEQNIRDILKNLFGLNDYHLNQLYTIINRDRAAFYPHIYEKIREIETQIRKGTVKNVKAYVVKALQNEFEKEDTNTYAAAKGTASLPNQSVNLNPQNTPETPEDILKRECFDRIFIDFNVDPLKTSNIVSKVPPRQLKSMLDSLEEELKEKDLAPADLEAQEYLLQRLGGDH